MSELFIVLDKNGLEYALRLYDQSKNKYKYFLVSGGDQGGKMRQTMSSLMKGFLIRRGISAEKIYEECLGDNLVESITNCKKIISDGSSMVPHCPSFYSNKKRQDDFEIVERKKFLSKINKIHLISSDIRLQLVAKIVGFSFLTEVVYHVQLPYHTEPSNQNMDEYIQQVKAFTKAH